jgi:hypothetical protein
MKKVLIAILAAVLAFGTVVSPVWASDWDKAGIALTGIEGLRIITGGKVDLIGSMFGMNRGSGDKVTYVHSSRRHPSSYRRKICRTTRVWVPEYRWVKEYVPQHEEYDPEYGKVIVKGHYIKYQVEDGGYWREEDYCG